MIKNIPNKYNISTLLEEINVYFKDTYDILNLTIDFINNCNFVKPLHIILFYELYTGKKWKKFNSEMQIGCTKEELEKLMSNGDFSEEVRNDQKNGEAQGLHDVPYFLVNEREVIDGYASKEEMKSILLKVLNQNDSKNNENYPKDVYCDEKGCYFQKK